MATHRYEPSVYHRTFGAHDPVLRVDPGDTVITTTVDADGMDSRGVEVTEPGNPVTGPFYVTGARPGDTLAIRFDHLTPNRASGWTTRGLSPRFLDPDRVPQLRFDSTVDWWEIDLERGVAAPPAREPDPGACGLKELRVPLAPMLGCLGVCPPNGQRILTAHAGCHGGNMDYPGYRQGITALLPVFVEGALFFLGDGHAVQGDGEPAGTGIETSFDVRFTLDLFSEGGAKRPRGESPDHLFTVGAARPLERAVQEATSEMVDWLMPRYGLDMSDIGALLGQCAIYEVGNLYSPVATMACKVPKRFLEGSSGL